MLSSFNLILVFFSISLVNAITNFQRLGSVGTVGYLPKVMPTFLENVKTSEPKVVDSYFNKLADLTKVTYYFKFQYKFCSIMNIWSRTLAL